jgi:hypothetical protein
VTLDRQAIEKKDFPIARRGYEPEAVDAHLGELSGQVEDLQRRLARGGSGGASASRTTESLALAASRQVQAIVEAAESSAAEIEAAAQSEAERIRRDASEDASRTREDAVSRSQEHVGQVREATSMMLQRVDAMETELGALIESLRTGANRLTADLSLLQGNMGELYGAANRVPGGAGDQGLRAIEGPEATARPQLEQPDDRRGSGSAAAERDLASAQPVAQGEAAVSPEPVAPAGEAQVRPPANAEAATARGGDGDVEGARLIALNMALNGSSREETDGYLAENFDLADRAALLDEVYATVEG